MIKITCFILSFTALSMVAANELTFDKALPPEHQGIIDAMRRGLEEKALRPYCVENLLEDARNAGFPIYFVGVRSRNWTDLDIPVHKFNNLSLQKIEEILMGTKAFEFKQNHNGGMFIYSLRAKEILQSAPLATPKEIRLDEANALEAIVEIYKSYNLSFLADPYSLIKAEKTLLPEGFKINSTDFLHGLTSILNLASSKGWMVSISGDEVATPRQVSFFLH